MPKLPVARWNLVPRAGARLLRVGESLRLRALASELAFGVVGRFF